MLELGAGKGWVPIGAHIGFWYRSPEEKVEALLDYFFAGLKSGQLCVYICPEADMGAFLEGGARRLGEPFKDVRMRVLSAEEFYLKTSPSSPHALFSKYPEMVRQAQAAGFPSVRAAGEFPRQNLPMLSTARFFEFEERLNRDFFELFPVVGMCLFNMESFGSEWTLGLMRTHPMLLSHGSVFENPSYRRA
jgi:hypothetical protein